MNIRTQSTYRLARWFFWILAAYFIFVFFRDHQQEIQETVTSVSIIQYIISILIATAGTILAALVWAVTINRYGVRRNVVVHAKAWATSRIGRYVPGKLLPVVMRFAQYEKSEASNVGAAFILENVTVLATAATLVLSATIIGLIEIPHHGNWALLILTAILISSLTSRSLNKKFEIFLKRIRIPLTMVSHQWRSILMSSGAQICIMAIHGLSLTVLILPMDQVHVEEWFRNTAIYYLAGLAGMAAIFTPGGLGVREGVLAFFLSSHMPLTQAVIVSLAIRIVSILADVNTCATFWLTHWIVTCRRDLRNGRHE